MISLFEETFNKCQLIETLDIYFYHGPENHQLDSDCNNMKDFANIIPATRARHFNCRFGRDFNEQFLRYITHKFNQLSTVKLDLTKCTSTIATKVTASSFLSFLSSINTCTILGLRVKSSNLSSAFESYLDAEPETRRRQDVNLEFLPANGNDGVALISMDVNERVSTCIINYSISEGGDSTAALTHLLDFLQSSGRAKMQKLTVGAGRIRSLLPGELVEIGLDLCSTRLTCLSLDEIILKRASDTLPEMGVSRIQELELKGCSLNGSKLIQLSRKLPSLKS